MMSRQLDGETQELKAYSEKRKLTLCRPETINPMMEEIKMAVEDSEVALLHFSRPIKDAAPLCVLSELSFQSVLIISNVGYFFNGIL